MQNSKTKIRKMKRYLPYGKFIFADGSQILFNRYYEPLINGNPVNVDDDMRLSMKIAKKQWFYNDSNPPWMDSVANKKCEFMLKAFDSQ